MFILYITSRYSHFNILFSKPCQRQYELLSVKLVKGTPTLLLVIGVMGNQQHFKQYVSYIVAVSFIGWMKKTTDLPQVTDKLNLIHRLCFERERDIIL
jgi:hypothetical protein